MQRTDDDMDDMLGESGDEIESMDDSLEETEEDFAVDSGEEEGSLKAEGETAEKVSISQNMTEGDMVQYTVEKGDSLMLISFKLYGDYKHWEGAQGEESTPEPPCSPGRADLEIRPSGPKVCLVSPRASSPHPYGGDPWNHL